MPPFFQAMIAQKVGVKAAGDTPRIDAGFTRKHPEHIHGENTFFPQSHFPLNSHKIRFKSIQKFFDELGK